MVLLEGYFFIFLVENFLGVSFLVCGCIDEVWKVLEWSYVNLFDIRGFDDFKM